MNIIVVVFGTAYLVSKRISLIISVHLQSLQFPLCRSTFFF